MLEELKRLGKEAEEKLDKISELGELDSWRLFYLGKKGTVTMLLRSVGKLPREERPMAGRLANEVRAALESAYEVRREALRQQAMAQDLAEGAIASGCLAGRNRRDICTSAPKRYARSMTSLGRWVSTCSARERWRTISPISSC